MLTSILSSMEFWTIVLIFVIIATVWFLPEKKSPTSSTPPATTVPPASAPVATGTAGGYSVQRQDFDRNSATFSVADWLKNEIAWYKQEVTKRTEKFNNNTPEVSEWLFWTVIVLICTLLAGLTYAVHYYIPSVVTLLGGFVINPQWLFYAMVGMYILAGFRAIPTDKVAGLALFGTPVWQFGNGLKWYPWLVFKLTIETVQLVQGEQPGDADHIFWDDEEKLLPSNMVRPIYVLSGENPNGMLPTDKQTNLGVSFLVKFQLTKERFFDLVRNVAPIDAENGEMIRNTVTGNQSVTDRLLEVLRLLRDTGSAFAAGTLGKLSYNEITTHRHLVDELLMLRIKLEIVPWGLDLDEARFTQINPGHAYNKDLQKRAQAVTERDRLTTVADGKAADIDKVGLANARVREAFLRAEATGQKAIRDELGVDGATVIGAEVGKEIAKGGNAVITEGGIGALGAMFAAGAEKTKKKGGSATPSDDT